MKKLIEVFVKNTIQLYGIIVDYIHTQYCDAEDITQATFEHFFRSFRSYHHVGKTCLIICM